MNNEQFLKKPAFTIVEILSVLAIIAIIGAAGIPSWSHFSASAKLRGEGDKILSNLYAAQQGAAAEQYSHIIRFFPEENSYKVIKIITSEDDPFFTSESEVGSFKLGPEINIENTTFENNELEFTPFGSASFGGNITLKNQKEQCLIIEISAAGVIKSFNN